MAKQPPNKPPKQNSKPKKSGKKKTLWDIIVDIAVILAGIGGLASLFFGATSSGWATRFSPPPRPPPEYDTHVFVFS
jgi:hypothetical protein